MAHQLPMFIVKLYLWTSQDEQLSQLEPFDKP